jgi:hypothetical protein
LGFGILFAIFWEVKMKITLESTTRVVTIENVGIEARVWEGTTERGVRVIALIPRLAVKKDQDISQFEAELKEQRVAPSAEAVEAFSLRMVI